MAFQPKSDLPKPSSVTGNLPPPGGVQLKISTEEMNVAFDGPSVFTNKFYITANGPVARVSFCEQVPNSDRLLFRAAVTMTLSDLLQLQALIQTLSANFARAETERAQPNV
jgi:hypothetical protein